MELKAAHESLPPKEPGFFEHSLPTSAAWGWGLRRGSEAAPACLVCLQVKQTQRAKKEVLKPGAPKVMEVTIPSPKILPWSFRGSQGQAESMLRMAMLGEAASALVSPPLPPLSCLSTPSLGRQMDFSWEGGPVSQLRREGQRMELAGRKTLSLRSSSPGSIRQNRDLITNHIPGFRLALDLENNPHQEHKARHFQEAAV